MYRTGDRIWHGVIGNVVSCLGCLLTAIFISVDSDMIVIQIVALTFAKMGQAAFSTVFLALQGQIIPKNCAASALSIIKTIGILGAVVGPYMIGKMKDAFGSYAIPMYVNSACYAITAILFFQLRCYLCKPLNVHKELAAMVQDDEAGTHEDDASHVELSDVRDSLAPLGEELNTEYKVNQ